MTAALDFALSSPRNWHAERALSQAAGSVLKVRGDYSGLDAALQRLEEVSVVQTNGFYNHAPMVVEALCAMGQGDEAQAWLDQAEARFTPAERRMGDLDPDDWSSWIGVKTRDADWRAFFRAELETRPWREVLSLWTHRLADGFSTSACHAVLQTAHMARALHSDITPTRLRALANALAAWADRYTPLPVEAAPNQGVLDFHATLSWITPLPEAQAPGEGAITAGYAQLVHADDFAEVTSLVDLSGELDARFDALMEEMTRVFLAHARTPYTMIVFTHAVTATAAARTLSHHVPDAVGRRLLFRAFEHGAALVAAFSPLARQSPEPIRALPPTHPAHRAVQHGDDHVIKLTEALLSAYRANQTPVYLDAIARTFAVLPAADQG
ncbi:questin oxidase family protein [Oceanicaulis sp. MMSF_3324]|uniref:questin oxidase family protein n=1 Tax=Oceanicaulis sp. MMSF_3324 TaxID=3046702 RepID=UPI00273DEFBA|nr:questin oxidase family protein [Oceanicaulis sp. MMSF_3324]